MICTGHRMREQSASQSVREYVSSSRASSEASECRRSVDTTAVYRSGLALKRASVMGSSRPRLSAMNLLVHGSQSPSARARSDSPARGQRTRSHR